MTESKFSPMVERLEKRAVCRGLLGSFLLIPAPLVSSVCTWIAVPLAIVGAILLIQTMCLFNLAEKIRK
ncbi:hypothetical protein KKA39_00795 [Patescibacteria group bacterium]|nr:hypothetical protein [Patescibacteria group bacterium]